MELRARKIERVAAAYVVGGWLLLQAASIVFPAFAAPVWALKVTIVIVVALFPFALWLAWMVAPNPYAHGGTTSATLKAGDIALLSLLAVVVLLSAIQLTLQSHLFGPEESVPVHSVAQREASIAILPFENLSSDKDTGYFAAGIQDEILTRLAKIGSLKVISRTSTAKYASRPDDLRKIGRELDVANILEGSVQRVGNQVRVNVQLIHATSDNHLWAEIYDRKLDDIFAVESDVANAIANALALKMTPGERRAVASRPTADPRAHDAYLRALALTYSNNDADAEQAIRHLEDAVKIDPDFVQAWTLLARVHAFAYFSHDATDARRVAVLQALNHALALQPHSAESTLAQGFYNYYVERDYPAALKQFQRAHAQWPSNADALNALGMISRRLGKWDEGISAFKQAIALNPDGRTNWSGLRTIYFMTRDVAANRELLERAAQRWPNDTMVQSWLVDFLQVNGDLARATRILQGLHAGSADYDLAEVMADNFFYRRKFKDGEKFVADILALEQARGTDAVTMADLTSQHGDFLRLQGQTETANADYMVSIGLLSSMIARQPDNAELRAYLAYNYACIGERQKAIALADRAVALMPLVKDPLEGQQVEIIRATVLAVLGERAPAIAALDRLLKIPSFMSSSRLRLDPDLDKLRGDPRFEALAKSADVVFY